MYPGRPLRPFPIHGKIKAYKAAGKGTAMAEKKTYEELEEYVRELEAARKGQENREYKSRA